MVRGRVFPDVTFGAEIEGCGWVDHAWMEGGLPTCHWTGAPGGLATRRQLRELGLSPGGHGPVAALRRRPGGYLHAWLYRLDLAQDKRNATPAVLRALGAAMRARRTCPTCRRDTGCCLPRSLGQCWNCWAAREGIALTPETTPCPAVDRHIPPGRGHQPARQPPRGRAPTPDPVTFPPRTPTGSGLPTAS
jgi:ribosomal protein L37AE/L43A